MREFIDDELEGRWCDDRWCAVVDVIDRETRGFLHVSWKREGRESWHELRHGIQKKYLLLENFPPNLFRGLLEEKTGRC